MFNVQVDCCGTQRTPYNWGLRTLAVAAVHSPRRCYHERSNVRKCFLRRQDDDGDDDDNDYNDNDDDDAKGT